jgi:hypothetical protein
MAAVGSRPFVNASTLHVLASLTLMLPSGADAQSNRELGVRDAFLFAPAGALPPLPLASNGRELAVRLGARAEYDRGPAPDDWKRPTVALSFYSGPHSTALTLGFISGACQTCRDWISAALDVERPVHKRLKARVTIGASHVAAASSGTAASGEIALAVNAQGSHWQLALQPGIGVALIGTETMRQRAVRPTIGATAGVTIGRVGFHAGAHAVAVREMAPVVGGALTWSK